MSKEIQQSEGESGRKKLPIERGFPIERVNEIAAKEGRAKMYYRPIYTMHKWWARRLGCVFRAISLYTLLDDPDKVQVFEPGHEGGTLADYDDVSESDLDIASLLERVDMTDPESLWDLYPKDVRIEDKKVLDPFMGGGTSLVEASRIGAEVVGNDLNPVAWFVTKKELEAGQTDVEELEQAFEQVKEDVADEITQYYKTPCPNGDHDADVMYNFWVKELDCVSCGHTVPLFKDYRVAAGRYENDDKYNVLCPDCESVIHVDDWRSECKCTDCDYVFTPSEGNAGHGSYSCDECGQKYKIIDAIQEQGGFRTRLYALEYYCGKCDNEGQSRSEVKGYKSVEETDLEQFNRAKEAWQSSDKLKEYVPNIEIPRGAVTATSANLDYDGHDVFDHGYKCWSDMFNERQLYSLALLLQRIDEIPDQNVKEYLLLAVSDSLMFQNTYTIYNLSANKIEGVFKSNGFAPQLDFVENNVWGTEYGRGTFENTWEKLLRGVSYASDPTERYVKDGESVETDLFSKSIGNDVTLTQGDLRTTDFGDNFDAVITDPPYYDNIIYSELSNFFYVWQQPLLESIYSCFEAKQTPRAESIVTNPAEGKDASDFEQEIREALEKIHGLLNQDGVLAFTYHHSDSESWGELLEALCDAGFHISAAYPVSADLQRFTQDESVSFDIIVVARPVEDTEVASWNSLRRDIYRTARRTRTQLEENRDLSRGDIGVMEMGACFREYSKHHGKVQRDGKIMSAKEVVQEIYGIIQEASDIGVEEVFIDLLDTSNVSYDDVNKLCRGTNATPDDLKELRLYNQDDGFELGTWDDEKRQAYIQERTNGDGGDHLSNLDKLQFLRYRYEKGQSVQNYVDKWGVDDDLRELAGRLADVTGDDTYTRVLGDRDITSYN